MTIPRLIDRTSWTAGCPVLLLGPSADRWGAHSAAERVHVVAADTAAAPAGRYRMPDAALVDGICRHRAAFHYAGDRRRSACN